MVRVPSGFAASSYPGTTLKFSGEHAQIGAVVRSDANMNRNPGAKPRRLVVGITGASGAILGVRLLEMLKPLGVESHLVLSLIHI